MFFGTALYRLLYYRPHHDIRLLDDRTALLNNETTVYFKHATKPKGRDNSEFQFTFSLDDCDYLEGRNKEFGRLFLALICPNAAGYPDEVCCLPIDDFQTLRDLRWEKMGDVENTFWLTVALSPGKSFRVYADYPGRRKCPLCKPLIVARNDFPNRIFQECLIAPVA